MNNHNNIFFSIIVTCYNNKQYLKQCLDSIVNQLKENYELIIIDDGSIDYSSDIYNLYTESNIKLIRIKHSGVSVARNNGIHNATGKYIIFIDGDDFIDDNSLTKIEKYLSSNNVNILLMDTIKYYFHKNNYYYEKMTFNKLPYDAAKIYKLFIQNDVISRPWRFIVKREYILKTKLYFYPSLLHEDEEWTAKLLSDVSSISYYKGKYYYYRKHNNSITTCKTIQNYKDYLKIVNIVFDYIISNNISKNYEKYLKYCMFRCLRNTYSKYESFDETMKKYLDEWYINNKKCYFYFSSYSTFNYTLQKTLGYKKAFYFYKTFKKKLRIKRNKRKEILIYEK